jgi:hypothetical protein
MSRRVSIPTPGDFQAEIRQPEINVLPLVNDIHREWRAGWCTYSADFDRNPDVEFFCGGVNHKTPTAAGLWRQGNLLHFGFEQSPAEMNETGRQLLLNSIAYVSRFSQDRPIAVTHSVFAGPVTRSRARILRGLRNEHERPQVIEQDFAPDLRAQLAPMSRERMLEWAEQNVRFLHPGQNQKLELDEDLVSLGVSFDQPEFFDKTIAALGAGGDASDRARRLLERYVPAGPKKGDAGQWAAWWRENRPYLFASDSGDYCWYLDPLAKARGVPTADLRGPKRADSESPVSTP